MNKLIIKSEKDLTEHFDSHTKKAQSLLDKMTNFEGNIDTDEYNALRQEYEKSNVDYAKFDLSYGKIVMYYAHEGEVISNIQYCPFCETKFEVKENE